MNYMNLDQIEVDYEQYRVDLTGNISVAEIFDLCKKTFFYITSAWGK